MSYIQYMSKYICCICIHLFLIECCSSPIFSAETLLLQKRSFEVLLPSDTKCRFVVGCGIASEPKSGQLGVGPTFRSPITWARVVESQAVHKGFPFWEAAADGRLSDPFAGVPLLLLPWGSFSPRALKFTCCIVRLGCPLDTSSDHKHRKHQLVCCLDKKVSLA